MNIAVIDLANEKRNIPNPVRTFSEAFEHYRECYYYCHLHWIYMSHIYIAEILREIEKNKFVKPTPIQVRFVWKHWSCVVTCIHHLQSQGWPILLQGRDLIGIAQVSVELRSGFLLEILRMYIIRLVLVKPWHSFSQLLCTLMDRLR